MGKDAFCAAVDWWIKFKGHGSQKIIADKAKELTGHPVHHSTLSRVRDPKNMERGSYVIREAVALALGYFTVAEIIADGERVLKGLHPLKAMPSLPQVDGVILPEKLKSLMEVDGAKTLLDHLAELAKIKPGTILEIGGKVVERLELERSRLGEDARVNDPHRKAI